MKIFLSYRFTGEDPVELQKNLSAIIQTLRGGGYEVYCSIEDEAWFREKKHTNKEIMEHAFKIIDECDLLLAYIKSDEKSEGMLVEIGYFIGKGKPFALALKRGVKTTSIAEMAKPLIEFDALEDLCEKLSQKPF
jgi:nucleoside 2-deoxyribosyltransferase